ncbi:hypothetical protein [Microlunatus parietis]|uniref:Uncharacterized protein n=1 Tax=Microlunatus parietis TaxID=682979 RepID=A0A7Y9I677_9ACTN|nr:hypothetical protein [Microlunatus parietis]NYE71019.1 hypothetical protein [Microlunatus parietis]
MSPLNVLLVVLYVAAGVAAAWEARRKGYHDLIFTVLGVLLGPILLLIMLFLPPRPLKVGQTVRPAAPIALEDGRRLRTNHVTVVRAVKVVDGELVCLITSPEGSRHWVAQEALSRVGGAPKS